MLHWYAISTKPHQERLAEANLQKLGLETFCPLLKEHRIIRRKPQTTVNPLFPGYMFARFNLDSHYRAVMYARGVRRVVSFGPEPAIVDAGMIEAIKSRLHEGYLLAPVQQFKPGQLVRILNGPLHGLEAVFEKTMTGSQRAVILLRALSYQARAVVDLRYIANL
jgi:transcriptional antiterminator RfaH